MKLKLVIFSWVQISIIDRSSKLLKKHINAWLPPPFISGMDFISV
jgi:hypothetical protein